MKKEPLDDNMLEMIIDYFAHQGERTQRFAGYLLDEIYRLRDEQSEEAQA